ncbi:MAG: hypothetical protein GC160_01915 [Acidobacteria bacterium]|nr:hypothetical protein [Acidobacteriota bacterium]
MSQRLHSALWTGGALLLVLLVYGQSVYRSPAFGSLADQGYHLAAQESFAAGWAAGEILPSWDAAANGGRGSPGFVLYPPLFAGLGAALAKLVGDPVEGLRLAFLLATTAVFGGVFYLACGWATPRLAASAASLALLLPGATFPSLARGMYPQFLALAWIALLLGALDRLAAGRRPNRSAAVLAIAAAGLILTHTLSAYMLLALLLVGAPWWFRALDRPALIRAALAGLVALAATAWFWVPMLLVAGEAQTDFLAQAHPYARSLWFGPRAEATALERSWATTNAFGQALAAAQLVLAALLAWVLRRQPKPPSLAALPAVVGFVACANLFPVGEWLTSLPGFSKLQFAWRWQGPLAVLCAAGWAAAPAPERRGLGVLAGLIALAFAPLALPAKRQPTKLPSDLSRVYELDEFEQVEPAVRAAYLGNRIEMRPLGADRRIYPPGAPGRWEVIEGSADVALESLAPSRRVYRISATTPVRLRLLTYAFSGWRASWNGRPLPIEPEPGSGLQLLRLPAGEGRLELRFHRWP